MADKKASLEELLPVMRQVLDSGGRVSFTPNGISMYPMLCSGRDTVTLKKPDGSLKKYDLPLYRRQNGQFVLHRIVGKNKDGYIMRGDNQLGNEYGVKHSQIVGVVTGFIRNGKTYAVTDFAYRLYVVLRCNPITLFLRRTKYRIKVKLKPVR